MMKQAEQEHRKSFEIQKKEQTKIALLELSSIHIITISYDIEKFPFKNLGNIFSHSNGGKMSNVSRLYMIMSTSTMVQQLVNKTKS